MPVSGSIVQPRLINDLYLGVEMQPPLFCWSKLRLGTGGGGTLAYSNHVRETKPKNLTDTQDQGKGLTSLPGPWEVMGTQHCHSVALWTSFVCQGQRLSLMLQLNLVPHCWYS